MKRNCRDDGCCCIFDEDGETQLEWCSIHAAMRDRIREQRDLLAECEQALERQKQGWDNVLELGLVPERYRDGCRELFEQAFATIAKLRAQERG